MFIVRKTYKIVTIMIFHYLEAYYFDLNEHRLFHNIYLTHIH